MEINWFNSEYTFFTAESVKRKITDLISGNLTDSDSEIMRSMLFKFEVDPSKIDWNMLVDKQKFHSHV